jgi:hypothetical protein
MSQEKFMSGKEFRARFAHLVETIQDDDLVYFGNADLSVLDVKDQGCNQQGQAMVQVIFNELYKVTA